GAVWDLPVMANYRFFSGAVRPYAGPGLVLVTLVSGTSQETFPRGPGPPVSSVEFSDHDWFPAYGAQAGLEWRRGHFVIRPEVRFSHRGQRFGIPGGSFRDKNLVWAP